MTTLAYQKNLTTFNKHDFIEKLSIWRVSFVRDYSNFVTDFLAIGRFYNSLLFSSEEHPVPTVQSGGQSSPLVLEMSSVPTVRSGGQSSPLVLAMSFVPKVQS